MSTLENLPKASQVEGRQGNTGLLSSKNSTDLCEVMHHLRGGVHQDGNVVLKLLIAPERV
ncbi:MAG: hypothetical protein CME26_06095 [Gemmatimonadetes bacterium]|nr:hypothetical protein [Gemmatimonadota bacterium]